MDFKSLEQIVETMLPHLAFGLGTVATAYSQRGYARRRLLRAQYDYELAQKALVDLRGYDGYDNAKLHAAQLAAVCEQLERDKVASERYYKRCRCEFERNGGTHRDLNNMFRLVNERALD